MVKVIVADSKLNCEHLLGQYLDESHFDTVINDDTDCFKESGDKSDYLKELVDELECLKESANKLDRP